MAQLAVSTEPLFVDAFCRAYLTHWDATKAYKTVRPDAKNCKGEASKLLNRPDVQVRLNELFAEKTAQADVGIERILRELEAMAFIKLDDYAEFIETAQGRFIPVIDMEKIRDNPTAMRALSGKFKRVIDKDGGSHDVYELEIQNKQAALFKLVDYHMLIAGKLAPSNNKTIMNFNVSFDPPGAHWRNQQPSAADLEPIDQ